MGREPQKVPKVQNCNGFQCFEEACQKNGESANGKLAEASHCKGGHVVHMCHPVLTLSAGGGPAPRGPPIYPSTHRSKLWRTLSETFCSCLTKIFYFYFLFFYFYFHFLFFYFYFLFSIEHVSKLFTFHF